MNVPLLIEKLFHEKAFEDLHKVFQMIFHEVENGVLIACETGQIIYTNPAYTSIMGADGSSRIGTSIIDYDPQCALSITLLTGVVMKNFRFTPRVADTELVANTTFITSASGERLGAISIFQDSQEILRLQNELAKKDSTIHSLKGKLNLISAAKYDFTDIVGRSPALLQTIKEAKRVASTDVTTLIFGESGTGKELFAHAIHANSQRRQSPFVRINCASIPENLIESELFGYEKGAFTGASQQKIGMFELANSGTILLDEIGEMSLQTQTRLLRVLEEREFYRLGGQTPVRLDIRVLASTNRNLRKTVAEGNFREDLFFRINIFPLNVPPLRERGEDVLLLAQHFLASATRRMEKKIYGFSESAKRTLLEYNYPGNIRELRSIIERAVVICETDTIGQSDLGMLIKGTQSAAKSDGPELIPLSELERQAIEKGLALYGNSLQGKQEVAKVLGISARTLYNRLKLYNLDTDQEQKP